MTMRGWNREVIEAYRLKQRFGPWAIPQPRPDKPSKYKAIRTRGYASRIEAERADQLALLERAGAISNVTYNKSVQLGPDRKYKPDFRYVQNGQTIWEEVKGVETDRYRDNKKLWRKYGPGLLRIVKRGTGGRLVVTEEIVPEKS